MAFFCRPAIKFILLNKKTLFLIKKIKLENRVLRIILYISDPIGAVSKQFINFSENY